MSPAGTPPVVGSGRSMYIALVDSSMKNGHFAATCAHSRGDAEKKCESPYPGGMEKRHTGLALDIATGYALNVSPVRTHPGKCPVSRALMSASSELMK